MTKEEYELLLEDWAEKARMVMRGNISSGTHGKGTLSKKLRVQVKENRRTSGHFIGFNFNKYGVFVHYGVGRGWIRQGGTVVRGQKVKKGSELEFQLKQRGYAKKDIKKYVIGGSEGNKRSPVDWFDSVLKAKIQELADIASEFYGDNAMEQLGEMLNRITIEKKYNL